MQYSSKFYIKVKNHDTWKRLFPINFKQYYLNGDTGEEIFNVNSLSYDWGQSEEWDLSSDELTSFVNILAEQLKEDAIIIAAGTCYSVDPYTFFIYSFGDGVKIKMFDSDPFDCFEKTIEEYISYDDDYEDEDPTRDLVHKFEMSKLHDLYRQTSIKDITEVLSYKNWFVFTDKELSALNSFGIQKKNTKNGPKYSEVKNK